MVSYTPADHLSLVGTILSSCEIIAQPHASKSQSKSYLKKKNIFAHPFQITLFNFFFTPFQVQVSIKLVELVLSSEVSFSKKKKKFFNDPPHRLPPAVDNEAVPCSCVPTDCIEPSLARLCPAYNLQQALHSSTILSPFLHGIFCYTCE